MNEETNAGQTAPYLKDAVAFLVTVTSCAFLVTAGWFFTNAVNPIEHPVLISPPSPPDLAIAHLTVTELPAPLQAMPEPAVVPAAALTAAGDDAGGTAAPEPHLLRSDVPYHGLIVQAAGRYEVDPHLIRAIILAESGFNPKAESKRGACGLMQLMPSTAESLGITDIYDPEENIDGGVRYFRSLLDRFDGDVPLALAAYNAGSRHVRNYEGIPPFRATELYIKKVLKFHEKFKAEMEEFLRKLA